MRGSVAEPSFGECDEVWLVGVEVGLQFCLFLGVVDGAYVDVEKRAGLRIN